ncbi:glycosyltransferase [Caballeronia sp. LjRoot34]|uniref:glycosyltransferase n=1 Tax=Caballeronia sp. LjRoot34 TaxID=3342325 RepID=UPI003ECFEE18
MRLGIYCDSGVNGGHEEMLKRLILALVECPDIEILHILVPSTNQTLFAHVKAVADRHSVVKVIALSCTAESIHDNIFARLRMTWRTAGTLRSLHLSKLVIAQGTITSGLPGLLAAWWVRTTAVSYLPLIDERASTGTGMSGLIKWLVKRVIYRLPQEYITLNEHLRGRLHELAPRARIAILENYVDNRFSHVALTRSAARTALGLPEAGKFIVAQIGRINFQQKRQDFLLACIERHAQAFRDTIVLIVGEGRDAARLQRLVQASETLSSCVRIVGPQSDVLPYIVASDVVALPSAYEGVPLVMIEAILAGRPIVASDVSGLDSYLPASLLFRMDDEDAFIEKVFASSRFPLATLTEAFKRRFSREAFDAQVRSALLSGESHGRPADHVQQNGADLAAK